MNKYKELFKNVSIISISQFSSKILIFLMVPLYTSVLTTAEYGIYDLVQTTIELLVPLLSINIIEGVMRFLLEKDSDKSSIITFGLKYVSLGISLGLIITVILNFFHLIDRIIGYEWYIYLLFLATLIHQFMIKTSKGLDNVKDMGIAGIIGTIITISSNLLFLLVFKMGLTGFFIANTLSQFIPSIYLFIRNKIWMFITKNNNKELNKQILFYCIPLIANSLAWWLNSAFDKYAVAFLLNETENGLLGVAYKIPTILVTIQTIFNQAWQISAVKEFDNKDSVDFFTNIYSLMNMLMTLSCSVIILFSKVFAKFMFANDFYIAWRYVPLLLVSCVINAVAGVIGAILGAKKDSKTLAIAAISGATINVVLNIFMVKLWGTQGAIIATVISSFVIFIIRYISARKLFKIKNIIISFITWIILIIQAVYMITIESYYVYIIQSIAFLIIVFVYSLKIKDLIKAKRSKAEVE